MKQSRRAQCRISCEIEHERRTHSGVVVDLAPSGLGLVTGARLHEADAIRVTLNPDKKSQAVEVSGIVWSERVVERPSKGGGRRVVLGIMLADVPEAYVDLLARHGLKEQAPTRARPKPAFGMGGIDAAIRREDRAATGVEIVQEPKTDTALPRAKFPLPPPKRVPEEELPLFHARAKLRGGARTRRVTTRAASAREAEERLAEELGEDWEILELSSARKG